MVQSYDVMEIEQDAIAVQSVWPGASTWTLAGELLTLHQGRAYTELWCEFADVSSFAISLYQPVDIPVGI
jgi:hypothetical protein